MIKKEIFERSLFLFVVGVFILVSLFIFGSFDVQKITGNAIFYQGNESEFSFGLYNNTFWNGSSVVLYGNNISGDYVSKVFDAGFSASWRNLSSNGFQRGSNDSLISSAFHLESNVSSVFSKDDVFYLADMKDSSKKFYLNFSNYFYNGDILKVYAKKDKGKTIGIYDYDDSLGNNPMGTFTVSSVSGEWKNVSLNLSSPTKSIWIGEGTGSDSNPSEYFDYFYLESLQNNLSFQVMNCSLSNCSDGVWQTVDFNNFDLNGRYFRYKVSFLSPNSQISPYFNSVSVGYVIVNEEPQITIHSPSNRSYYGNKENLNLSYIVYDSDDNIDSCWYNINAGTNLTTNCLNVSFNVSGSGNYFLNLYVNDSLGEVASSRTFFSVSVDNPSISIFSFNNSYFNFNSINFSYVPLDNELSSCSIRGNFTGEYLINKTEFYLSNGSLNSFFINLSDGFYLWNIICNDTFENFVQSGNSTFYVDTIKPFVNINQPIGLKDSRIIYSDLNVSENNLDSCWYNIYNLSSLEVINTTVNCYSSNISFNVTSDSNFTFNFYVNDSASNINSSSSNFSVVTSSNNSNSENSTSTNNNTSENTENDNQDSSENSGGGSESSIQSTNDNSVKSNSKNESSFIKDKGVTLEINPLNFSFYPKQEKSFNLVVKNNGLKLLNKCKLLISKDVPLISKSEQENIGPNETVNFSFVLNFSSDLDELNLSLECLEGVKTFPIFINLVNDDLELKLNNISLIRDNKVVINYMAYSNSSIKSNVTFSVFSGDRMVAFENREVIVGDSGKFEDEISIQLEDISTKTIKILVKDDNDNLLLEDSIVYNKNLIVGFATLNIGEYEISYILVGIILVSLIVIVLIILWVLRVRHKKN